MHGYYIITTIVKTAQLYPTEDPQNSSLIPTVQQKVDHRQISKPGI